MGLADFFRRHRNVFSLSTQRVDVGSGNEEMLEEEYGERAVEERRSSGATLGSRGLAVVGEPPQVDVSVDGILEASEDGTEDDKPHPQPSP